MPFVCRRNKGVTDEILQHFAAQEVERQHDVVRQGDPDKPYQYARIVILFKHDSLRVRDGDNQLSAIQDLLKRAKVIEDDCWTRIGTPVVEHDVSAFAECVIKVMEITPIDWSKKLREEKSKNLFASRGKLNTEE